MWVLVFFPLHFTFLYGENIETDSKFYKLFQAFYVIKSLKKKSMWESIYTLLKNYIKNHNLEWAWWNMPLMPAFGRQRQADILSGQPGLHSELENNQGSIERPCLKQNKTAYNPKATT